MTSVVIEPVHPHDDELLRAWWEIGQRAQRAARTHPVLHTFDALAASVRVPSRYRRRQAVGAWRDGTLVGALDQAVSLEDNQHLVDLEINVEPSHQRAGVGGALFGYAVDRAREEGRTTILAEVNVAPEGDPADCAAYAFATAMGCRSVHVEDHLVLEGPFAPSAQPLDDAEYEIVSWAGRCPDEYVEAYARMRSQMESDVPLGEVDYAPTVVDAERVRVGEERLGRSYDSLVAAARRRADGELVGYSVMLFPRGEVEALQDDTLVMPGDRGRRLGLRLKTANLRRLVAEHPGRTAIHTWTSVTNTPMQRTNRAFGFVPVERLHEMQRRVDP